MNNNFLFYVLNSGDEISKCDDLNENLKLIEHKPKITNLKNFNIPSLFLYIFWFIFTHGKYRLFYVLNPNNEIVHYTHLLPKFFKFPFINKNDYIIGPSWTREDYRRKGIFQKVMTAAIKKYSNNQKFYGFVFIDNIASQKGLIKMGFKLIGSGGKSKILGIYKIFVSHDQLMGD